MQGIFFGLNTIDLQFMLEEELAPNKKYKATEHGVYVGGPATNACITYSFLGGEATLITPVGDHDFSSFIHSDLLGYDIHFVDPLQAKPSKPVFASVVTTSGSGDRAVFSYHPNLSDTWYVNGHTSLLEKAEFLLLDGFYMDQAIELATAASKKKLPVILDAGSWKNNMEKLLPYVTICLASSDFHPPGCKDARETMNFLAQFEIEKTAITRGHKSILYNEKGTTGNIHIPKTAVVDTLGAGDIFHGAFCYYYQKNHTFIDSLLTASDIASESCKHFGTRAWMQHHKKRPNV